LRLTMMRVFHFLPSRGDHSTSTPLKHLPLRMVSFQLPGMQVG
jgi:hypothetical protein